MSNSATPDLQDLADELSLWEISAQLKAIKERLSLIKVECREIQALKTGLFVAESALESLLK